MRNCENFAAFLSVLPFPINFSSLFFTFFVFFSFWAWREGKERVFVIQIAWRKKACVAVGFVDKSVCFYGYFVDIKTPAIAEIAKPLPPLTPEQRKDLETVHPNLKAQIERMMWKKNQCQQQQALVIFCYEDWKIFERYEIEFCQNSSIEHRASSIEHRQ